MERTDSRYTEIAMNINIEDKLDINFISIFSENKKEPVQLPIPLVECATSDNKLTNVIPLITKGVTDVKN